MATSGYRAKRRLYAAPGGERDAARGWDSETSYGDDKGVGHEWAHHGYQVEISEADELDADYRQWRNEEMARLDERYRRWKLNRSRSFSPKFDAWRERRAKARAAAAGELSSTGEKAGDA